MRVLGIDFGTKQIGLAVSDPEQRIATPLRAVSTPEAMDYILGYIAQEGIHKVAMGKPLALSGEATDATAATEQFVQALLARRPNLRITYIDERYTSKMAQEALRQGGASKKKRRDKALEDKIAATLILQAYFNQYTTVCHPIQMYGQAILRSSTQPIKHIEAHDIQVLIESMFRTMYQADGIGLAAPQIGYSCQLFIVGGALRTEKEWYEGVFINPTLEVLGSNITSFEEGCLSIPDIRAKIDRPTTIKLRYQNVYGAHCVGTFSGLLARVIQHEYDHLHGKLFIDYLSVLKRSLMEKKLRRISAQIHVGK